MAAKYLSTADIAEKLGVTAVTIHKRVADGSFPKPDEMNGPRRLWAASTVKTWQAKNKDLLKTMKRRSESRAGIVAKRWSKPNKKRKAA